LKRLILFLCALSASLCPVASRAADARQLKIGAPIQINQSGATVSNTFVIDGANKAVAWVFQAENDEALTSFIFRFGASAGTPVAHRISIQGVSVATGIGMPNGTVAGAAVIPVPATSSWDQNGTAFLGCGTGVNCVQVIPVTNDASGATISSVALTRGQLYSIVIETCAGSTAPCSGSVTADVTNKGSFVHSVGNVGTMARGSFPYALTNTAALPSTTWTKVADTPIYGYRTANGTYGAPLLGLTSTATNSGAEVGVSFNFPSTWFSTYKVSGIRYVGTSPSTNSSVKLLIYDTDGSAVPMSGVGYTWDTDAVRVNATGIQVYTLKFQGTLPTLSAGTTYRISLSPQGASTGLSLATWDLQAAGDRSAFPGGTSIAFTSRTGCTGVCDAQTTVHFTDNTSSRPFLELLLEDITAPTSTGGSATFIQ